MTVPASEPTLTVPYVGVNEFRSAPTWLDSMDLVESGNLAAQDSELYHVLLRASGWAWNFCNQPLHAHSVTENLRCRVDKWGKAAIHPMNNPVRSVQGIAFGADPAFLQPLTNLTSSTVWIEDQRGLIISLIPTTGVFTSLQFGNIPPPTTELYMTIQYVAGYANTVLTQAAAAGDPSLHVLDPTGFTPPQTNPFGNFYGGSVARIWDPGAEEAISVPSSYVAGANPVTLSASVANAHGVGAMVSEFPPEVRQAIICYAVALLCRDDASDEGPYPGSPGPTARRSESGGKQGGFIEEAERLLMPYRRVR